MKAKLGFLILQLWTCLVATAAEVKVQRVSVNYFHQLDDSQGAAVRGHLVEFNGRLYGLAGEAGPNRWIPFDDLGNPQSCYATAFWRTDFHEMGCPGSLFSFALDGSDFRVEYAFSPLDPTERNDDGYHPYGSLSLSPSGRLWGVT